jgi:hypothetical protein
MALTTWNEFRTQEQIAAWRRPASLSKSVGDPISINKRGHGGTRLASQLCRKHKQADRGPGRLAITGDPVQKTTKAKELGAWRKW